MVDEEPTDEEVIKEIEELQGQLTEAHFAGIGKGITAWSRTEGNLVVIAAMLLDTEFEKAGLIFYSIPNFYTWLSIIDELFALDPRYQALRPDWREIAEKLKKLNDTRVRLAHHAVYSGRGIREAVSGEDMDALLPSLKPNPFDTRMKSKKHGPLQIEQLVEFLEELTPVAEKLTELMKQMSPIYLGPKKRLLEKVRNLQQQVSDLRGKKDS
jgi:DNA repair exonuclease SbcCD ATPase subunit